LRTIGLDQEALTFGILITGDEEVGGFNGARKVLEKVDTAFCIALDGGDTGKVVVREKGIWRLQLISKGRAAHGARPWLGDNAIEKLIDDYAEIKRFFEYAPGEDTEHWHRTINFSILHAGRSPNQVPDYAEALFDIRYTETDRLDELLEKMRSRIKGELREEFREPIFRGGDSPHLDRLLEMSPGIRTGVEHGASDARFLSSYGIPGIVWGADGEMSQHTLDEHVVIDSIYELFDILNKFVQL
jgi:succinyl-diaminopimelate desuccinylase